MLTNDNVSFEQLGPDLLSLHNEEAFQQKKFVSVFTDTWTVKSAKLSTMQQATKFAHVIKVSFC